MHYINSLIFMLMHQLRRFLNFIASSAQCKAKKGSHRESLASDRKNVAHHISVPAILTNDDSNLTAFIFNISEFPSLFESF